MDWLDDLLAWNPPPLPAPFSWISDWVMAYIIDPFRLGFVELRSVFQLFGGLLALISDRNRRVNIAAQLRNKLVRVFERGYNLAKQKVADLCTYLSILIAANLSYALTVARMWVDFLATYVVGFRATFDEFVGRVYNSFVATYTNWKAWIDYRFTEFSLWTREVFNYWHSIWWYYRQALSDFLSDPATFIVAHLIIMADKLAEDMRQLAVIVLEKVW